MDMHKRIAGLHPVTFMDIYLHHTSGKLAGNADGSGIGLTFDDFLWLVKETETEDCKHYTDDQHDTHGHHENLVFALFGIGSGAILCI